MTHVMIYYDGILDTDDNDDKKIRGGWADS